MVLRDGMRGGASPRADLHGSSTGETATSRTTSTAPAIGKERKRKGEESYDEEKPFHCEKHTSENTQFGEPTSPRLKTRDSSGSTPCSSCASELLLAILN